MSELMQHMRPVLARARDLHREGQHEDAVDLLVEWLDKDKISADDLESADVVQVHQAMLALGCWSCNILSTVHLCERRVARAFGYTRTCQRWLGLHMHSVEKSENSAMWLRLRFDCALNAAELAQSSGDYPGAVGILRVCERLQDVMDAPNQPEVVHLCLAEALLQSGCSFEAIQEAQCAAEVLRLQQGSDDRRKIYSLVFALSLEQAAMCLQVGLRPECKPPVRALHCLTEAEEIAEPLLSFHGQSLAQDEAAVMGDACRVLLEQMRHVHCKLMEIGRAGLKDGTPAHLGGRGPHLVRLQRSASQH